jgi:DNA polymerase III delta prime subunit
MTTDNSSATAKNNIPWVEKYRPTQFDDIVLDPLNRKLFSNILKTDYFPNLLFYGPPGTGKTTTIINLINSYQKKHNQVSRSTVLHLNASDERGIDVIRNQIFQFVRSKNLFEKGIKFVILDEVDYMTKNAQQALKYLLQSSGQNVRFCLICNYISKIDESLKNEFIAIRFNQLPKQEIDRFLTQIAKNENIELSNGAIDTIQKLYKSDIRSMINFIQLHQSMLSWDNTILTDVVYENIYGLLCQSSQKESQNCHKDILISSHEPLTDIITVDDFLAFIYETSIKFNIDKRNILKNYFNYILRNKPDAITPRFIDNAECVVHSQADLEDILKYTFYNSF